MTREIEKYPCKNRHTNDGPAASVGTKSQINSWVHNASCACESPISANLVKLSQLRGRAGKRGPMMLARSSIACVHSWKIKGQSRQSDAGAMYPGTKKKKKGRVENASVRAGNRELSGPERPRL